MERRGPAICALLLIVAAVVHFDTVSSSGSKRNFAAKPGLCPPRQWGSGACVEFCSRDNDCANDEKCCSNRCGHECITPYTVKPGRCPLPQSTPICAEYCYHDGECPGEQKCCRTTCGHACSKPCWSNRLHRAWANILTFTYQFLQCKKKKKKNLFVFYVSDTKVSERS